MCLLLKRLEMQGFKSFADKTVFDFTDGTTAIVGPNGSGKSNISDAIRWVIGEMSAKSLRGSNMQDVIFAGTQMRKPLNYAEVSLVLDNSTHIFDIDFNEVVVTRRLFRSGESVYQINKASCRLKDIHELFMDTGLGRDGYSIIGQGNVSQILSTKAEDRRSIFEEAAGVSKYKYRKDEAIKKLAGVEENLVRINDIAQELKNRLEPLEKQSKKAREYLELYSEYKSLDVDLSLVTLRKNREASKTAEEQYNSVDGELRELRSEESETERRITELYDESKKKDTEKTHQNSLLIEKRSGAMSVENDITIAENDIKNNRLSIKRLEEEIMKLNAQNDEAAAEIEKNTASAEEKEREALQIIAESDAMQAQSREITAKQDMIFAEMEQKKTELTEKQNSAAALKAKLAGIEDLRKSLIERRDTVEAELKHFNENRESIVKEIEQSRSEAREKTQKLEKTRASIEDLNNKNKELREKHGTLTRRINDADVERKSKVSKKRILEGLENDYAGYAKSVKAVLKANDLKRFEVYGTVSGLIDVKREYATAIETALGGALQNIVVGTEEDAKEAIAYLKRTKQGRATFLPISAVKGRELENAREAAAMQGYIGLGVDLIAYDKKYSEIMKSLLGRVVVADNIDNAVAMARKYAHRLKIVTLAGELLNPGGSMTGGSVNKQSGFLSRAAEIKTLGKEISELTRDIAQKTEERDTVEKDISLVKSRLDLYIPMARGCEEEIIRLESTAEQLDRNIEDSGHTEESYRAELNQTSERLSAMTEEIAEAVNGSRAAQNAAKALEAAIAELNESYRAAASEKEEKAQAVMETAVRLSEVQKDANMLKMSAQAAEKQIENTKEIIVMREKERDNARKEIESLLDLIESKKTVLEQTRELCGQIEKKITAIDVQKSKIMDTLKDIQNSNKDLTDRLLNLQQELSRVEAKRAKLDTERENTINRLWEEYELTLSAAEEISGGVENEKEAFAALAELKGKLKALGSVNVDAIEEYKSVRERYEFLSVQKDDLEKSQINLNKLIASTEELMEEHFSKRFKEINESFAAVFRELFGGGKGELYLSDPDSVLESGIEIKVQLPGKGLQNINLYSGGEKSFIAIALLFAILRVNPTPFCILDEIDAALDDVNVSRFATYLKNYTDRTQFIVITHRRGTMEAANILYGVTMQEKGVSKLLSLMIDEVGEDMAS